MAPVESAIDFRLWRGVLDGGYVFSTGIAIDAGWRLHAPFSNRTRSPDSWCCDTVALERSTNYAFLTKEIYSSFHINTSQGEV